MEEKEYRPLFILQGELKQLLKGYLFTQEEADALIRIIQDRVED